MMDGDDDYIMTFEEWLTNSKLQCHYLSETPYNNDE